MRRKILAGLLSILLMLPLFSTTVYAQEKMTAGLERRLEQTTGTTRVLVYLEAYDNLEAVSEDNRIGKSAQEQQLNARTAVIDEMKSISNTAQSRLVDYLEQEKESGRVKEFTQFFIINALAVEAEDDVIRKLAEFPEVVSIALNDKVSLKTEGSKVPPTKDFGWEMPQTKVSRVWDELEVYGENAVIGFIDSGVDWTHPGLQHSFRGYNSATGAVSTAGNWMDLVGHSSYPVDISNHGTAIAGVSVGRERDGGNAVGVAPGAKWIAVRAFDVTTATNENIIIAGEWMLAPNGDPALAPDIINNSWGSLIKNEKLFDGLIAAWKAADILPVFAAGNSKHGATEGSIENPAHLPDTLAVGAVDKNNQIARFSKRGPSIVDGKNMVKPDLVAPGMGTRTAYPGGYTYNLEGTSLAAAHVTGVAALVKSANPTLSALEIKQILLDTAQPVTDGTYAASPNNAYGHGVVNAYGAVRKATVARYASRISGDNRYTTAVEISKKFYPNGASTVYVASGDKNADALAMGPLTNLQKGPLLLTGSTLDPRTLAEIQRLSPSKIVIIGGAQAVSDKVANQIAHGTNISPTRIFGENRYETANAIANTVLATTSGKAAFLVNGYRDADAVSITPVATRDSTPILSTDGGKLSKGTIELIKGKGIQSVTVVGGSAVISEKLEKELSSLGIAVKRLWGADRYATSNAINKQYFPKPETAVIANGITIIDALSAGPIAGSLKAPVVLASTETFTADNAAYLTQPTVKTRYVMGGENAIPYRILEHLFY